MKLLYSVSEACQAVSISRARLYELIAEGELVSCKLGKRTLFRVQELERFVNALPSQLPSSQANNVRTTARSSSRL